MKETDPLPKDKEKFWRNPAFLKALFPVLLAAGILLVLFSSTGDDEGDPEKQSSDTVLAQDAEEQLLQMLSSLDGVSEAQVYVTFTEGKASGVVVLCRGGSDPTVQKTVLSLVTAMYDIGTNRVFVGEGKPRGG